MEMLPSLDARQPVYVLMDSWYPSKTLMGACLKKGLHVIAMLKTNRILYPKGTAIQAKKFAESIEPRDTHLVTVGKGRYCVLSTDRELSDEDILRYYAERWSIECFFRQSKDQLKPGWIPGSSRSGGKTVLGDRFIGLRVQHRRIPTKPLHRAGASSVAERPQRRRVHL